LLIHPLAPFRPLPDPLNTIATALDEQINSKAVLRNTSLNTNDSQIPAGEDLLDLPELVVLLVGFTTGGK